MSQPSSPARQPSSAKIDVSKRVRAIHFVQSAYRGFHVRRQLQMGRYDTYVGAARGLVAAGGVRRLYAGLAPYLFRAGPGAAIQFATFGELKKLLDSS